MNGLQRHALQGKLNEQLVKLYGDDYLKAIKSLATNIKTLEFSNSMTTVIKQLSAATNTYTPYLYNTISSLNYEPPKFGMNDILDGCCDEALSQLAAYYNIGMPDSDGKFANEIKKIEQNTLDLRFNSREFHLKIVGHCKDLFIGGHYSSAVQEACKVYTDELRKKSGSNEDGHALMKVLSSKGNVMFNTYDINTESAQNYQSGLESISRGIISAFRNVSAHETAKSFGISPVQALDMLSTVSFLLNALDKATASDVGSSH